MVLISVLLVFGSCRGGEDDLVIGVVGPTSGQFAQIGIEVRNGATLAAEQINRRGGFQGKKVRIAFRDDADRSTLVRTLRDLIDRERPSAIIGPETIAPLRSRNNPLARAGIPSLTVGGSAGSITGNQFLFRMSPANRDMATVMAEWLVSSRGMKRVSIVSSSDEWGADGSRVLKDKLKSLGAEVVASHQVQVDNFDPAPLVQGLRDSGAEALALWVRPEQAARIASAVRAIGWTPQIVGPDVLLESRFRSLAGSNSDNVAFVAPKISEDEWFSSDLRDWFLEYHRRFTILPIAGQRTLVADVPFNAVVAYDAVNVILDAVARSDSEDPKEVGGALRSTKEFKGVIRSYTFTKLRESYASQDLSIAR
ncbi:MAG TPA: ABC transporter substrate-binding protein, partial [Actinomycetota bacterium]|nr:ABC transporter substrate-binding protein [Actinomycetota bacterium]